MSQVANTPWLTYTRDGQPVTARIDPGDFLLGRLSECDLVLSDEGRQISRRHAAIRCPEDERWVVEDLGSRNGTWVNGAKVERCDLRDGDVIRLGSHRLVFNLPATPGSFQTLVQDQEVVRTTDEQVVSMRHARADGQREIGASYLVLLERLIHELSGVSSPVQVRQMACHQLCEVLPADVVALIRVDHRSPGASPQVLAIEKREHPEGSSVGKTNDFVVSSGLIRSVLESGTATTATAPPTIEQDHASGLLLSSPSWTSGTSVSCAVSESSDAETVLLYVVFGPRDVEDETTDLLGTLAKVIGAAAGTARHTHMLEELQKAVDIQSRLVMPQTRVFDHLRIEAFYEPCGEVGGDYCDAIELEDNRVACVVADVCGKGYPAALVMSNVQASFRSSIRLTSDAVKATNAINDLLLSIALPGTFVTFACIVIDPNGEFEYVNAGHLPPLLVDDRGGRPLVDFGDYPLGIGPNEYDRYRGGLERGQSVLMYTDGVTESFDAQGGMLGIEGVLGWLNTQAGSNGFVPERLYAERLADYCREYRSSAAPSDDQTILNISYGGLGL